jgi:predicted dinucleotide-binding enzyme
LGTNATTTSELLARHLKHSKVFKAFNAILQADLAKEGRPAGSAHRRALPISGDDLLATITVTQLVNEFGYDVIDAGLLSVDRSRGKISTTGHGLQVPLVIQDRMTDSHAANNVPLGVNHISNQ